MSALKEEIIRERRGNKKIALLTKIRVWDSGRESIGGEEGEGREDLLRKQERNKKTVSRWRVST